MVWYPGSGGGERNCKGAGCRSGPPPCCGHPLKTSDPAAVLISPQPGSEKVKPRGTKGFPLRQRHLPLHHPARRGAVTVTAVRAV